MFIIRQLFINYYLYTIYRILKITLLTLVTQALYLTHYLSWGAGYKQLVIQVLQNSQTLSA